MIDSQDCFAMVHLSLIKWPVQTITCDGELGSFCAHADYFAVLSTDIESIVGDDHAVEDGNLGQFLF